MGFKVPYFTQRMPVAFVCTDVPSLTISGSTSIQNNPMVYTVKTGSVAKVDAGLDGQYYFRGDGEYPPILELEWKTLSYTDYTRLAALRPYYVHFISYRNIAFYGKLVMDGPVGGVNQIADVVSAKGTFYVLTPSDIAGASGVARVPAPSTFTTSNNNVAGGGYIGSGVTNYYWMTFGTNYAAIGGGETLPTAGTGNGTGNSSTNSNTATTLTWTWPSTTKYVVKASIYVSNTNNPATAVLLADIPNGLPATWIDYVGTQGSLVNRQPPASGVYPSGCAPRGLWQGGLWQNETP